MKRTLVTLALVLSILTISAATQEPKPPVWEYKFEYKMNEKKANELGIQGWELAAIESTSTAGIGNNVPVYVFKRSR